MELGIQAQIVTFRHHFESAAVTSEMRISTPAESRLSSRNLSARPITPPRTSSHLMKLHRNVFRIWAICQLFASSSTVLVVRGYSRVPPPLSEWPRSCACIVFFQDLVGHIWRFYPRVLHRLGAAMTLALDGKHIVVGCYRSLVCMSPPHLPTAARTRRAERNVAFVSRPRLCIYLRSNPADCETFLRTCRLS